MLSQAGYTASTDQIPFIAAAGLVSVCVLYNYVAAKS